jgi:hypothetical protein
MPIDEAVHTRFRIQTLLLLSHNLCSSPRIRLRSHRLGLLQLNPSSTKDINLPGIITPTKPSPTPNPHMITLLLNGKATQSREPIQEARSNPSPRQCMTAAGLILALRDTGDRFNTFRPKASQLHNQIVFLLLHALASHEYRSPPRFLFERWNALNFPSCPSLDIYAIPPLLLIPLARHFAFSLRPVGWAFGLALATFRGLSGVGVSSIFLSVFPCLCLCRVFASLSPCCQ